MELLNNVTDSISTKNNKVNIIGPLRDLKHPSLYSCQHIPTKILNSSTTNVERMGQNILTDQVAFRR